MNKKEVTKDLGDFKSMSALKDSNGGKLLIKTLLKDTRSIINELTAIYKTASHIELVALISGMEAKLSIYNGLVQSDTNKELAQEVLDQILKDENN